MESENDIPNGSVLQIGAYVGFVHLTLTYRNEFVFSIVCLVLAVITGVFMGNKVFKIKDKKIRFKVALAEYIFAMFIIFISLILTPLIGFIYTVIILAILGALYVKCSPKYLKRNFV
ncbi:MAG: hypothetical protein ACK5LT_08960 [Lachnospirales bacterium]